MKRELKPASLVVVDEEPTDPGFGSQPDSRSLSDLLEYGIIPLDKPRGPTSHEVVAWVRRLLGVSKAGHRRTKVGRIDEREGLVNRDELSYAQSRLEGGGEAAMRNAVRPVERYLRDVRTVVMRDSAVDAICHGARLAIPGILSLSEGIL